MGVKKLASAFCAAKKEGLPFDIEGHPFTLWKVNFAKRILDHYVINLILGLAGDGVK